MLMINDQGGIRKVNFISRDDSYSPPKTVEDCRQALPRHVVDDIENAEAAATSELIVDKVERPACIWLGFNEDGSACAHRLAATSAFAHGRSLQQGRTLILRGGKTPGQVTVREAAPNCILSMQQVLSRTGCFLFEAGTFEYQSGPSPHVYSNGGRLEAIR